MTDIEITDEMFHARRQRALEEQDWAVVVDCDLIRNPATPGADWHAARRRLKALFFREHNLENI
jgi:hypothetical protein